MESASTVRSSQHHSAQEGRLKLKLAPKSVVVVSVEGRRQPLAFKASAGGGVELVAHPSIACNSAEVTDGMTCCTLRDLTTAAALAPGGFAAVRPSKLYLYARVIFKGTGSAGPASRYEHPDRVSMRQPQLSPRPLV
jgi:hypothetical protein